MSNKVNATPTATPISNKQQIKRLFATCKVTCPEIDELLDFQEENGFNPDHAGTILFSVTRRSETAATLEIAEEDDEDMSLPREFILEGPPLVIDAAVAIHHAVRAYLAAHEANVNAYKAKIAAGVRIAEDGGAVLWSPHARGKTVGEVKTWAYPIFGLSQEVSVRLTRGGDDSWPADEEVVEYGDTLTFCGFGDKVNLDKHKT